MGVIIILNQFQVDCSLFGLQIFMFVVFNLNIVSFKWTICLTCNAICSSIGIQDKWKFAQLTYIEYRLFIKPMDVFPASYVARLKGWTHIFKLFIFYLLFNSLNSSIAVLGAIADCTNSVFISVYFWFISLAARTLLILSVSDV